MPTILFNNGFRFFFYSNENNEPAHVHVKKAGSAGKIWLTPALEAAYMHGFSNAEQKEITAIAINNYDFFKNKWNEYFNK